MPQIRSRLLFLVKDPHWTFIGWRLNPDDAQKVIQQTGDEAESTPLFLRIHDVTDLLFDGHNSHMFIYIDVSGENGHYYFCAPHAGRHYLAELGVFSYSGDFLPLLRSNTAYLPPDTPPFPTDPVWVR